MKPFLITAQTNVRYGKSWCRKSRGSVQRDNMLSRQWLTKRGDSFFPICPFLATLIMYKWDLCIKKGSIKGQQNTGQVLCFPYIGEAYLLRQETLLLPIPICLKLKTLLSRKIQETMLQKECRKQMTWNSKIKNKLQLRIMKLTGS